MLCCTTTLWHGEFEPPFQNSNAGCRAAVASLSFLRQTVLMAWDGMQSHYWSIQQQVCVTALHVSRRGRSIQSGLTFNMATQRYSTKFAVLVVWHLTVRSIFFCLRCNPIEKSNTITASQLVCTHSEVFFRRLVFRGDSCTDSGQTLQNRQAPGSAYPGKILPQSPQAGGNAAPKIWKISSFW